ncbi:hypothetical protein [Spirosoma endophyticum]|uniref:Uncharacterized protein n=1 Tax=Spirosoma endophyticum TaxID=662367 RepID=A0A1I2ERE5_9BACT|nr:hypothetical protein [Spirosoma endophyticum]SFE95405.1 hypothetical protein SAMN05216167_12315 [Spirosoma endophyticum]
MLTLYIKSIDSQKQLRTFECQLYQLETVLDTLNLIAAAGSILLETYIVEDGHRTNLAHQAFDGQDVLRPIWVLQTQWEALLSQPREVILAQIDQFLLEMVLQRIDQYETVMANYDCSITKLEQLMLKTQQRLRASGQRAYLLSHYQTILTRQHRYVDQAQAGRDEWLEKLTRLKQAGQRL